MEGPFSIAAVFLLDKAHRFVSRLHWAEKLEEIVLWGLYAAPSCADDLSDSAKQRLEEGDLLMHIRMP